MTYRLLSVGPKSELLTTRNAVLRKAGFVVHESSDWDEAVSSFRDQDFDAAVVCHSIPTKDRKRLVTRLKDEKPETPVVLMSLGTETPVADVSIHSLDGPEEMLRQLQHVVANAKGSGGGASSQPSPRTK
jgi:DNA-binding NtrC family response regulator